MQSQDIKNIDVTTTDLHDAELIDEVQDEEVARGSAESESVFLQTMDGEVRLDFPWFPAAWMTSKTKAGEWVTKPVQAPHINLLYSFLQAPSARLAERLLRVVAKDILLKGTPRVEAMAWQGNMVVSSRLPAGMVVVTNEFIVVSRHFLEKSGEKWDFDGDGLALLFDPRFAPEKRKFKVNGVVHEIEARKVHPWKDPMVNHVKTVWQVGENVLSMLGPEPWFDFTPNELWQWLERDADLRKREMEARGTMSEREAIFRKTNTIVNVGIADVATKSYFLAKSRMLDLAQRQTSFYDDRTAFHCIEQGGLGQARKDHSLIDQDMLQSIEKVASNKLRLHATSAPLVTRTGSIGGLSDAQLGWVWEMDILQQLRRVAKLDALGMRVPGQRPAVDSELIQYPNPAIGCLIDNQVLAYKELPNPFHADIPPAVVVQLQRPFKGEWVPVALTDIRKAQGVSAGHTYCFILPPVWDVEANEGKGGWKHPLAHMMDCSRPIYERTVDGEVLIEGFDGRVLTHEGGDFVRYWLHRRDGSQMVEELWARQLSNPEPGQKPVDMGPKHAYKVSAFMGWLQAYVGRYGMVVPMSAKSWEMHRFNEAIASNTVVVDYGRMDYDVDMWWACFQKIPHVLCPASKGDDQRVRKHAMVTTEGDIHAWYAPKWSNARRSGQMLSQLSRARILENEKGLVKMRVAMVCPSPLTQPDITPDMYGESNQVQITPSGIAKQMLMGELGGTVFNDRVSHKPDSNFQDEVEFMTLGGEVRKVWMRPAKSSKNVGKLVSPSGEKFMPLPTGFHAWTLEEVEKTQTLEVGATLVQGDNEFVITEIQEERVLATNKLGQRVQLSAEQITEKVVVKERVDVDLFIPVRELIEKGVFAQIADKAVAKTVIMGDGREVLCLIYEQLYFRTTTPTENMRPRLARRRIRGFNGHLAVGGARRGGTHGQKPNTEMGTSSSTAEVWEVKVPNEGYVEQLKEATIQLLDLMGFSHLLPNRTDLSFEAYTSPNRVFVPRRPGGNRDRTKGDVDLTGASSS